MHSPLPRWLAGLGQTPWGWCTGQSSEKDLPTRKPQMLSQELSDLLQLTLGWFTSATGSRYKASWERTVGSGTLSPDLLPCKFHTARLSLSTASSESVLTSGSSGSQSRTSLSDIISPFSLGSSLSKWIPPDTTQIPLFKMYLSFILLVVVILKKKKNQFTLYHQAKEA